MDFSFISGCICPVCSYKVTLDCYENPSHWLCPQCLSRIEVWIKLEPGIWEIKLIKGKRVFPPEDYVGF